MSAMTDPIPHCRLFHTPESTYELDCMIKSLSQEEQAIAYRYTMLAFNLAHKLTQDAKNERTNSRTC
jgi:hypothetical protein